MNEVKQIEEMARTLCKDYNTEKCVTRCANYGKCTVGIDANTFYFAGYRKQSEVARDIFEEIDGITDLFAKGLIGELEMYDMIANLKKKYTENEGKG